MSVDITTISVEMDTSSLQAGQVQLNRTATAGVALASAMSAVAASFGVGLGITELTRKLVDTERATGSMMASLEVATGGIKNAESAFASLAQLGAELPESLNDVTKAFTMMVNRGLDPSQAAMKSYSNTASAMNKDLMQMVEAVADAATGSFVRLEEFGIKARTQGDKVAFSFRGTTTTVKNNADAINDYLKAIGDNEFAGLAEKKMATLDGAISNLSDSWDGLFRTINKQGSGQGFGDIARTITGAIGEFDKAISSGQIQGYIDAIGIKFNVVVDIFVAGFDVIIDAAKGAYGLWYMMNDTLMQYLGSSMDEAVGDLVKGIKEAPENIKAFIQIIVVELLSLSEKAAAVGNVIRESLNPVKAFNGEAIANFRKEMERINGVRDDSIAAILKEKDATTEAAKAAIDKANANRKNADAVKVALEDLGKYKVQASKVTELTKEQQKALEDSAKKEADRAKNIADMVVSITRETDLMNEQSKEAQIRYDIEKNILQVKGGILGAEAQALIAAAALNDEKKKALKAEEDLQDKIMTNSKEAIKAVEDIGKEAEKQAESISQSLTDALMRGFESGKGFAENFRDTLKSMFKTLVLKPLIQPIMDKAASSISSLIGTAGTKGSDGKTSGGSGALGAIGAFAPYVGIAVAVGSAIVGKWNERMEKGMLELTSEYRQSTQSTGTLLGNANLKSDSINKALSEMGDNGASLLDVNHGMYQALLDIKTGIAGTAAGFARQGLGKAGAASGIATGVTDAGGKGEWAAAALVGGVFGLAVKGVADFIGGDFGGFVNGLLSGVSKAIYNKKVSITDTGIQILGDSLADMMERGSLDAVNYAEVKTTKKVLGVKTSVKSRTETEEMDEAFKMQFAQVFEGAGKALEEASKTFGVNFDASKLMIDATKLSLKDLEGEALTKEIENFFSATLDKWAGSLVDGLTQFQQVGEGAFETMVRLASQTNIFTSYAEKLLPKFNMVGFAAIEVTQSIAELSGGFDRLQTNMGSYYQNFFSETEKSANGLDQIKNALAGVGVAMPTTREEFRALVESLDLTSEAQQKQYAALMDVNQAFAQFVPAAKEAENATTELVNTFDKIAEQQKSLSDKLFDITATDAQKKQAELDAALSDENRAIQQQIHAAIDLSEATKKAADDLESMQSKIAAVAQERYGLESQLLSLQGDTQALRERELATLDESNRPLQNMIWSIEDFAKESEKAAAEVEASAQKIAEAAKAANDERFGLEREYFNLTATEQEKRSAQLSSLLSDEARLTQSKIYSFNDAKKAQEEAARQSSEILKAQEQAADAAANAQKQQLEDAKRAADEQRKLAQGVHDSISGALKALMGESESLNSMTQSQARLTLQNALMTAKAGGSIVGFAGLDDALSAVQKMDASRYSSAFEYNQARGQSIGILSQLEKYTRVDGSHANGLDYVPFDGYVAQLHKGERVMTSEENKGQGELIAEIRALRSDLKSGDNATNGKMLSLLRIVEKWDGDGLPLERVS